MLIILPDHLRVSGITTWAIHAVKGLRGRGLPAGLIVHTLVGESVPDFLSPYVVARLEDATPIHRLHGNLDELVGLYLKAIRAEHAQTGKPVVVSPNLHGDCYGAIAEIAKAHPDLVRVVSWVHSDNEYDIAVSKRYEPMLHAVVPVSRELRQIATRSLPHRADDIFHIPYCVDVCDEPARRESTSGRPLRIVYTGRLEEHQKRASTLPLIAKELDKAGLDFEFRVVGDGPEMDKLVRAAQGCDRISFVGAVQPHQVRDHLRWADAWVLPSRYEGQSVAMLEALAEGCVPIVTKVRSGAGDAVIHGETGLCVDSEWTTPIDEVARRMARAILSLPDHDTEELARNAHRLALSRHSLPVHIDVLERLIGHVSVAAPRPWPDDVRASYSAKTSGLDGSTPPDAAKRMLNLLKSLNGNRVVLYCSGQHTVDVGAALKAAPVEIAGIIDDDPAKEGTSLIGFPIYTSSRIPELNVTDLVISSWIYEDTIWERRAALEAFGVRVHRLYPTPEVTTASGKQAAARSQA